MDCVFKASVLALPGSLERLSAPENATFDSCGRCIGQSLARIMHDTSVARLYAHFSFALAPRMGGPAGVDAQVGVFCSHHSVLYCRWESA